MRRLGCLTFTLIVLGVVLYFGDLAATSYAEERTAERVSRVLDADAQVEFDGWPVSLRLLQGRIPTATLTASEVPLENGAILSRLRVELTEVEVNVADLRRNTDHLPPADQGSFEATLTEDSVAAMLGIPADLARVRLRGDGILRLRAAGLSLDARVEATDGDVAVSLAGPLAQVIGGELLRIDLSNEPGAPHVEQVVIDEGVMVVRGTLEDVRRSPSAQGTSVGGAPVLGPALLP